jgi:predicted PhzF superfamily epimerase YddE/YHI9
MGRPSTLLIEVELKDGQITAVRVGGTAVSVAEGTINIP